MKPNKNFHKRKATSEQIEALTTLYAKNKALKTLVRTFDLDLHSTEVSDAPPEKSSTKINSTKTKNKMGKPVKKEFKNEVEGGFDDLKFIDIPENKTGIIGTINGEFKMIEPEKGKGEKKCFVFIDEDEQAHLLPSNFQLVQKIEKLVKMKAAEISLGIDVQIINEGLQKVEGVDNKMKVFKVLTT